MLEREELEERLAQECQELAAVEAQQTRLFSPEWWAANAVGFVTELQIGA